MGPLHCSPATTHSWYSYVTRLFVTQARAFDFDLRSERMTRPFYDPCKDLAAALAGVLGRNLFGTQFRMVSIVCLDAVEHFIDGQPRLCDQFDQRK